MTKRTETKRTETKRTETKRTETKITRLTTCKSTPEDLSAAGKVVYAVSSRGGSLRETSSPLPFCHAKEVREFG